MTLVADSNSAACAAAATRPNPNPIRPMDELPQDLAIEVLSYLNLRDSNHLAHVTHSWLKASRVERRRIVKLTDEMLEKIAGKPFPLFGYMRPLLMPILHSPLARLITHLPDCRPLQFISPASITNASTNFPNLFHIVLHLYHPLPNEMKLFHLPSRLETIKITADRFSTPITCERQQSYLDRLVTAGQLHTVCLSSMDHDLNLAVLTQLPLLTDLMIFPCGNRILPNDALLVLMSLSQLTSLRLTWDIQPEQWCQLRLPHLLHISHDGDCGVNCSTDLVPLSNTVMAKSILHLRLRVDAGADLSQLMLLSQFTQLHELDLFRYSSYESPPPLTDNDLRRIHTALIQLKTLTSLKTNGICLERAENISLSEVFAASPHLTALELKDDRSNIDCDFLRATSVQQRLVELNLEGYFRGCDLAGLLQCVRLRRLRISFDIGRIEYPSSPDWWSHLAKKLDSRLVLPALEHLTLAVYGKGGTADLVHHAMNLSWDLRTGSKTHPNFRLSNSPIVTVADAAAAAAAATAASANRKAAPVQVAVKPAPPATKLPLDISMIGADGLGSITQLLGWEELILLSQISHLFYNTLKRRTSYYQVPFPSFHLSEFNIVAYDEWQQRKRQPLMMTLAQLLSYSRSLVMSHQSDIILHIGRCQTYSKSSFHTSFLSLPQQMIELRSAVKRFANVRSFKLLFHPHPNSFKAQCDCRQHPEYPWSPAPSWHLVLASLCLEEWGANLFSFEWEIHQNYDCILPKDLVTSRLRHLTSLQHFGLYLPSLVVFSDLFDPDQLSASLRFVATGGLLVFSGAAQQLVDEKQRVDDLSRSKVSHNASRAIWLNTPSNRVFEYLNHTNQLMTEPPLSVLSHLPYLLQPAIPITRSQVCSLDVDSIHLRPTHNHPLSIPYGFSLMKDQLQMMIDNCTAGTDSLESLRISDFFSRPEVDAAGVTSHSIDFRPYLRHLRPHLRQLQFTSDYAPHRLEDNGLRILPPALPFDLVEDGHDVSERVWSRLEVLDLSYPVWELTTTAHECSPFDQETLIALGRTLPKLHTLQLSCRLLPLDQPFVGVLTHIKHLAIYLNRHTGIFRGPDASWTTRLNHYTRMVMIELTQLESLDLSFKGNATWETNQFSPYLWDNLLPILLSSNHLQSVKCDYLYLSYDITDEDVIDPVHESNVLYCYAIWQLLQPSLVVPLDYTSTCDLISPLFYPMWSSDARRRFAYQNLIEQYDRSPPPEPYKSGAAATWLTRIDTKLSQWKSRWHHWRHQLHDQQWHQQQQQLERERRIEARRRKLKQIQVDLGRRLKQLLESTSMVGHTIMPRSFTIQLVP